MKKLITTKITLLSLVLIAALSFTACNDIVSPGENSDLISEGVSGQSNFNLPGFDGDNTEPGFDGDNVICTTSGFSILKASNRSYNAGTVEYTVEEGNLIVTYLPAPGVTISEVHLWVGMDLDDMPAAGNGAPRNGHFPYRNIENIIPLEDIPGYTEDGILYIVAHAVVRGSKDAEFRKTETAYAGDEKGNSKRWFWYIAFGQEEECVPVDGQDLGTAG